MELLGIGYSCSGVRGQQMVLAVSRVGLTGVSRLGRLSSWWLAGRGVGDSVLRASVTRWEVSDGNQTGLEFMGNRGWHVS